MSRSGKIMLSSAAAPMAFLKTGCRSVHLVFMARSIYSRSKKFWVVLPVRHFPSPLSRSIWSWCRPNARFLFLVAILDS